MRDEDKLKFTFTIDPDRAGLLIIAALKLDATIDQCVWEQTLPFNKNKPAVQVALREVLRITSPDKRRGRSPNQIKPHYSSNQIKRHYKEKTNVASMHACAARLKEAGEKGVGWDEIKKIYMDNGALPQGINSALRTLATKKGNRLFLRSDAKIHGKELQ